MVEIQDAKIEVAETGESTLCLMVRLAQNDDGRLILDGLNPQMFRVNLSINPVEFPKHHDQERNRNNNDRTNIVMASPPVTTIAPVMGPTNFGNTITDTSKMMGPTTTTTTTQSNQQTTQQQLAQQQQMGDKGDGKKDKKHHKKKKKHDKCKHLKGEKKKKCEEKHKHHHGHEHRDAQKKKTWWAIVLEKSKLIPSKDS